MLLDTILERNRVFVREREGRPLPPIEPGSLAVVACHEPRLDLVLLPALGLKPGEALLLRTPGALVQPGGDVLRSLGLAAFTFGITEMLVVGHTSCRLASFTSAAFIDMFRGRGVSREAFGPVDLREWAGAIPSPVRGVQASVANIVGAPFLPSDVTVSGAVLDDGTGVLEPVVRASRPGSSRESQAVAPVMSASVIPDSIDRPGVVASEPSRERRTQPDTGPTSAARPSAELAPVVAAIGDLLKTLESQAKWRPEVQRLRQEVGRAPNPLSQLALLESFVRRASVDSREVAEAFERLKRELGASRRALPAELVGFFKRLSGDRA
jgi:carbonic anhydrase